MTYGGFGLDEEPSPGSRGIDLEKIMDEWEIEDKKLTKDEKKALRRIFTALGYNNGGGRFFKRKVLYGRVNNNYELIDMLIDEKILVPEEALEDLGIDGVVSNDHILYQLNMQVLYNL